MQKYFMLTIVLYFVFVGVCSATPRNSFSMEPEPTIEKENKIKEIIFMIDYEKWKKIERLGLEEQEIIKLIQIIRAYNPDCVVKYKYLYGVNKDGMMEFIFQCERSP